MAKLSKKSRQPEAPAFAVEPARRAATRGGGSAVADPGAADHRALGRSYRTRRSREIDPPARVQLQIARLSEATIHARTMTMEADLHAMDRLIELTRELDRYHGFAPAHIPESPDAPPPRRRPAQSCLNPARREVEGKFSTSQPLEIARNREGISETSPPAAPRRSLARSRRIRPAERSKGNFPPRNPLKSLKTGKESGKRRRRRNSRCTATPAQACQDRKAARARAIHA